MSGSHDFVGVISPVLTPFGSDGNPDAGRYLALCKWLLADGCTGLAPFGTTGEANSLGVQERMDLLDALVEGGIDPKILMPGTGLCALSDTATVTAHAVELGCGGVMMLPPFYYKAVNDDGLFAYYADIIERVGDARLKIYLYHIPPVAQVGLSVDLVGRLIKAYPDTVVGLKDSSGDWSNTKALLDAYPGFTIFPGLRGVSAGWDAERSRGLHYGDRQCECADDPQRLRQLADRSGRRVASGDHVVPEDHSGPANDPDAQGDCGPLQQRSRVEPPAAALPASR